jgi:hypothetical protein
MIRAVVFGVFLAAVFVASGRAASAACGPTDPTGHFEGTAQSKQAGTLKVALNLRCDAGVYAGSLVTPAGTFAINGGANAGNVLTLSFGGGASGDLGSIVLTIDGTKASGTFTLGADAGTFDVVRVGDARAATPTVPDLTISSAQWHDDLHFLNDTLTTKHVQPFAFTSREKLAAEGNALEARLNLLNPDQIYVGFDRLANAIGDGHTYVEFPPDQALFPLVLHRFGSDYRVVAVGPGAARALGMRVVKIDDTPVQAAHDALLAMTPIGETNDLRDLRATSFLVIGMALHGSGIIADRAHARYTVEDDAGRQQVVTLQAMTPAQADAVQYRYASPTIPLYRQKPDDDFGSRSCPMPRPFIAVSAAIRTSELMRRRSSTS